MAPLCSSDEGSTHRKCPGVDTRSVRRASGLLETRFSSLDSRRVGNSETIVRSTNTKSPNHSSTTRATVLNYLSGTVGEARHLTIRRGLQELSVSASVTAHP